jgi:SAM-dependent methyltransferase
MEAAASLGWSVEGVEPSGIAVESARSRTHARLHLGLLETLDLPEAAYDAITFFDALRTVPDPMTFLRRARRLLRPGGMLVIREVHRRVHAGREWIWDLSGRQRTPGRRAFEYRQCFSPRSLLFAFEAIGLTGAWVEPSPVFAEPDGKASLSESALKRAMGFLGDSAYRVSGRRLVLGPNLLAFGRAPSP